MKKNDFIRFKALLLCYGVSLNEKSRKKLFAEHPEFFEKGFIDAVNLSIQGMNICISIAEEFSKHSELVLDYDDEGYFIEYKNEKARIHFFEPLPKTGTIIDDMARLHSETCVNIWPSTKCCYDREGIKCQFCSLLPERETPYTPEELCPGLKILCEKRPDIDLNFSGGTYHDPDTMVRYWIELTKEIRKFSNCNITIEFAPPTNLALLQELKDAGCNAALMNLEIADDKIRRLICPGKSAISKEHYHKALQKAVDIFGFGMVSSTLIGGIQPRGKLKEEIDILAKMGVYVTIMPFRPLDNGHMAGFDECVPEEIMEVAKQAADRFRELGIDPRKQPGCTECGGCSLENEYLLMEEEKN